MKHARSGAAWLLAAALFPLFTSSLTAQGAPPEVQRAVRGLVQMLEAPGDEALETFARENLSPSYRDSFEGDGLLDHLRAIRRAADGSTGDVSAVPGPRGPILTLRGAREVTLEIGLGDDGLIDYLELLEVADSGEAPGPITWDNLLERIQASGQSGVARLERDGRLVAERTFGMADPERGRATELNTVYGIGSTPIEFTITGVLLLAQRGLITMDDPIAAHLPGVPAEKAGMTIEHLMTGQSGLPDFHDLPEVDWDPDLSWITRAEAERRILSQPLLFEPGEGQQHSHAAFVLLAAMIEHLTGESYPDFVRREILEPAGMERTGFYGERLGLEISDFAVGAGPSEVGLPNIPPNWGPTSWLIMGSGGMFSTLGDMRRFYAALEEGRILTGEWRDRRVGPTFGIGGSERGFFYLHGSDGEGNRVIWMINGRGMAPEVRAVTSGVVGMIPR